MFYTDGKILTEGKSNLELLQEAKVRIERWFELERGIAIELEFDEESDFPAYKIPEEVDYDDLYSCLAPDLSIRGINNDVLKHPQTQNREVKHNFSDEEISEMAVDVSAKIIQKAKMVEEKSIMMKKFASQIAKIEKEIADEADMISQGYVHKTEECHVVHNFKEKKVYYFSTKQENVLISSRDMEKSDTQLQLFMESYDGDFMNDDQSEKGKEFLGDEVNLDDRSSDIDSFENEEPPI